VVGRESDKAHAQILAQLMKLDPVLQMGQDKMIPMIALGNPVTIKIPLCKHYLTTWSMTFQSGGLILNTDGSRMTGGIDTCGIRSRRRLFSLGVHGTVFQEKISAF
jgi:hypothetical protein